MDIQLQKQLLNLLRKPRNRAELAKLTNRPRSTIYYNLQELIVRNKVRSYERIRKVGLGRAQIIFIKVR